MNERNRPGPLMQKRRPGPEPGPSMKRRRDDRIRPCKFRFMIDIRKTWQLPCGGILPMGT